MNRNICDSEEIRSMETTKSDTDSEEDHSPPPPLPPLKLLKRFPPKSSSPVPSPLYRRPSNHFPCFPQSKVFSFSERILSERLTTPPHRKPGYLHQTAVVSNSSSSPAPTPPPPPAGQDGRSCKFVPSAGNCNVGLKKEENDKEVVWLVWVFYQQ